MRLCSPFTVLILVLGSASSTALLRTPEVGHDGGAHADLLEQFRNRDGQVTGKRWVTI
jgi:hypothetical protein